MYINEVENYFKEISQKLTLKVDGGGPPTLLLFKKKNKLSENFT